MKMIHEPIDVETRQQNKRVFPESFVWRGERHRIRHSTLPAISSRGAHVKAFYYVETETQSVVKITYDLNNFRWELDYRLSPD